MKNAMGLDVLMKRIWNYAYEANNGFKKRCNWFRGMLIDNTIDLEPCLWSNAINLEQFLWNAINFEICLDVDSIVEPCLWNNTIDFDKATQWILCSSTMDLELCYWSSAFDLELCLWSKAMDLELYLWINTKYFELCFWSNTRDFELCLWAT